MCETWFIIMLLLLLLLVHYIAYQMTGSAGWHSQPVTVRSSIMIDSELTGTAILRSADQRFTGGSWLYLQHGYVNRISTKQNGDAERMPKVLFIVLKKKFAIFHIFYRGQLALALNSAILIRYFCPSVRPPVCLSVCLSVTLWCCVWTNAHHTLAR